MSAALPPFDALVVGAGAIGLAAAAGLKLQLGRTARIGLIAAAPEPAPPSERAVAVARGSRFLLERLQAWDAVAPRAQPITQMAIYDGGAHEPRIEHLTFAGAPDAPLAHMAYAGDIAAALAQSCAQLGVVMIAGVVKDFAAGAIAARVTLTNGDIVAARLVVGADGAASKMRALADIAATGWDYSQSAIVATIAHERPHEGRAEQHFLPNGPFAALPLPDNKSSIVWNESHSSAAALLALDEADFLRQLEPRFTLKLGALRLASRPIALPLSFRIARSFIAPRLALIGDAAHVVHPLAGQGLNLGFRDVGALVEAVDARMKLGLDPGAIAALEPYQRARRFDATISGLGMDIMNRLFSNDLAPLRLARDLGLRLVDRAPTLKRRFVREAAGASRAAPPLLRENCEEHVVRG